MKASVVTENKIKSQSPIICVVLFCLACILVSSDNVIFKKQIKELPKSPSSSNFLN